MAHSRTVPRQVATEQRRKALGTGVGYLGVSVYYLFVCVHLRVYAPVASIIFGILCFIVPSVYVIKLKRVYIYIYIHIYIIYRKKP